jgi:hypothetical protein
VAAWEAAGEKECPERQAAEKACRNLEKAARIFWNARPAARLYRGCYEWLAGRPREAHRAYAGGGHMFHIMGLPSVGAYYMRKAQALAGQESSDELLAWVGVAMGMYLICRGEIDRAAEPLQIAIDAAGRVERSWDCAIALEALVFQSYCLGRYPRSLEGALQYGEAARRSGDAGFASFADALQAMIKLQWGQLEEAGAYLDRASAAPAEVSTLTAQMFIRTSRARLYLRQGRPDLAVREAEEFNRQIEENPFVANAVFAYGYAAAAETAVAAWEAAGEKECPERQAAEKACRNLEKAARIFWNARPAARLYRGCYEWLAGRPREAHRAWAEALATARVQGVPYEEGLAHYETGRHLAEGETASDGLGRREHLERAAEIFTRLEIPYELNLARAATLTLRPRPSVCPTPMSGISSPMLTNPMRPRSQT